MSRKARRIWTKSICYILVSVMLFVSIGSLLSFSSYAKDGSSNILTTDVVGTWDSSMVAEADRYFSGSTNTATQETFWTSWRDSKYVENASGSMDCDELTVYFTQDLQRNTTVRFLFRYYVRAKSGVNKTPSFNSFSMILTNPRGTTNLQYNYTTSVDSTIKQATLTVEGTFDVLSANLSQIQFADMKGYYTLDNPTVSGTMQYMFGNAFFRYFSNDVTESYGSVLEQIKTNTGNTNNSVNNQGNAIQNKLTSGFNQNHKDLTQIHNDLTKQTDTITNGYDNSGMESSNKDLSGALDSFDKAESDFTGDASGYIDSVSFYNPVGVVQVMGAISFTTAWLQSLFVNMEDWGALVMVALSLSFGLMLVGWFRFRK